MKFIVKVADDLIRKMKEDYGIIDDAVAAGMVIKNPTWYKLGDEVVVEDLGVEGWIHPEDAPDCDSCDRIDPDNPPIPYEI